MRGRAVRLSIRLLRRGIGVYHQEGADRIGLCSVLDLFFRYFGVLVRHVASFAYKARDG